MPIVTTLLLATALTTDTKAKIDQLFAAYDKSSTPGCAVAIVRNGAVMYERGYGMADLDNDVKITPSTNFDIASTSKEFTGAIIMQLVAEGKLKLDDDIRKYVPEIPDYGTKITIAELLHHTSGLRDYTDLLGFFGYNGEDWTGEREALMLLSRQKNLNFTPNTEYSYSNTGFFLLTVIAKRASGKPFRDLVRERIFTPLGMSGSDVRDDHTRIQHGRAVAYEPHGDGWSIDMSDWEQVGDGGVNTSADDMAKWVIGGTRFIDSLATFEKLASGETPLYGAGLTFGKRAGHRMLLHNGAWAGYRSVILMLPDDHLSTAVLCNAGNANPGNLGFQIVDTILGPVPSVSNEPIPLHTNGIYLHVPSGTTFKLGDATLSGGALQSVGNGRFAAGRSGLLFVEFKDKAIDIESAAVKRHYVLMPPPKPFTDEFNGRYQSPEISADWTAFTRNGKLFLSGDRLGEVELTPLYENAFSLFGYVIEFNSAGFTLSNRGIWRFPFVRVK